MDTNSIKINFFNTWWALGIFFFILLFQPYNYTFYAIRPSDVWLWSVLFLQKKNVVNFKFKWIISKYGIYLGILAFVSTIFQLIYTGTPFKLNYLFMFYKFFVFYLIFIMIKNISWDNKEINKLLYFYTALIGIGLIMVWLQFNRVGVIPVISNILYNDISKLDTRLLVVDRAFGMIGNANAMSVLIATSVVFPFFMIFEGKSLILKILAFVYVFFSVYEVVAMTGSRTGLLSMLVIPLILLFNMKKDAKSVLKYFLFLLIIVIAVSYYWNKFSLENQVQNRIVFSLEKGNLDINEKGTAWTPRVEMWKSRYKTLKTKGNPASYLIGLGFTKLYKDYSDNGFVASFINTGVLGLYFKIVLYVYLLSLIKKLIKSKEDNLFILYGIVVIFIISELTMDSLAHYKLGQVFFSFIVLLTIFYLKNNNKSLIRIKY